MADRDADYGNIWLDAKKVNVLTKMVDKYAEIVELQKKQIEHLEEQLFEIN